MSLKDYDIPIDLIAYEFLRFVSYFKLDHILPCFRLTPREQAIIKFKIYTHRLQVTKFSDKTEYRIDGVRHRLDGPAVEFADGGKEWFVNGRLHRDDGPAAEYDGGDKYWCIKGKLHREDGPAIEWSIGHKKWFINGKLHRDDGPAIEYANGEKEYWIKDRRVPRF
jgi:hypothetical protein